MRVRILGRWWQLQLVPQLRNDDGQCDPPETPGKRIRIKSSLRGQDRLETLIHEMTHAANWHLDEDFVREFADDLARTLWRLGYRNEHEQRKDAT